VAESGSSYLYLAAPTTQGRLTLLVKGRTGFDTLAAAIRSRLARLEPGLLVHVQPLEANLDFWRREARSVAVLALMLSALALALACIGVYGVVSYVVTCRRREIGIRMTLGATARAIHVLILGETLRPVALGLFAGVVGAAASSHLLRGTLFGISPLDPIAFAVAIASLLGMAAAAVLVPTRQSLIADPVSSLRHD
jgi:predicted lysophospholipase L1 biosynthesis ABC-type transport system permease subunit